MNETDEEVTFLNYEQCPECRTNHRDNAGDNLARYSDGHVFPATTLKSQKKK